METTAKTFAARLKAIRLARGLTQEALSECLGVSGQTIQNWEHGRRWPEPESIDAAAKALGCDPWDLLIPVDKLSPEVGVEVSKNKKQIQPGQSPNELAEGKIVPGIPNMGAERQEATHGAVGGNLSESRFLGHTPSSDVLNTILSRLNSMEPKLNQAAILASTLSNANRLSDLEAKSAKPSTDKPTPSHASLLGEAVAILAGLNESELRTVMPFIQNAQSMSAKRSGSGQRKKLADDQG